MSTERPILFSGPMVRALLTGAKTQTRRLVKPQPIIVPGWATLGTHRTAHAVDGVHFAARTPREAIYAADVLAEYADDIARRFCPYGVPGDRLWVREPWRVSTSGRHYPTKKTQVYIEYREKFRATGSERWQQRQSEWTQPDDEHDALIRAAYGSVAAGAWRPSIHMPRWASRIDLEVVSVRVERLHDITQEDARAEGVDPHYPATVTEPHAVLFQILWDRINGAGSWALNPWVWRIEFRRLP